MSSTLEYDPPMTPEQRAKVMLLELRVRYEPQGWWAVKGEYMFLVGANDKAAVYYFPTLDELLFVAASPGTRGLRWLRL